MEESELTPQLPSEAPQQSGGVEGSEAPISSVSTSTMIKRILKLGLVDAPVMKKLLDGRDPATELPESDWVLRALVQEQVLTDFQAAAIRRGRIDDLVVDNYIVLRQIGRGGMGRVYEVIHRRLCKRAALKLVDSDYASDSRVIRRFQREVESTARLVHPNLVTAFDAGEFAGRPYLVMEFVDGADLNRLIKERGSLPLDQALDILTQAARGLREAHKRGIVHRDIKPHNLLVSRDGVVKVSDLGLARVSEVQGTGGEDKHELTRFGSVLGTVYYISPEQARNARDADERSDIYSLGCTLHTMLTGLPPFRGETAVNVVVAHRMKKPPRLRDSIPGLPSSVESLFQRMLAKNPADRPQSMDELLALLDAIVRGQTSNEPDPATLLASTPLSSGPFTLSGLTIDGPLQLGLKQPDDRVKPSQADSNQESRSRRQIWPIVCAVGVTTLLVTALFVVINRRSSQESNQSAANQIESMASAQHHSDRFPEPRPLQGDFGSQLSAQPDDSMVLDQSSGTKGANQVSTPPTETKDPTVDFLSTVGSPRLIQAFPVRQRSLCAVGITPDGEHAFTSSIDGRVLYWDLRTGRNLLGFSYRTYVSDDTALVECIAVDPEGLWGVLGGSEGSILIIDLGTLQKAAESGDGAALSLAFRRLEGHEGRVLDLTMGAEGKSFISSGADGTLRSWDLASGEEIGELVSNEGRRVFSIDLDTDRLSILSSGENRRLEIRESSRSAAPIETYWEPEASLSALFCDEGKMILSAGLDGLLRLWNRETGRLRWRLDSSQGRLYKVAVSRDGTFALSVGERDLVLRDVGSGKEIHRYPIDETTRNVCFVPGYSAALTGSDDGRLRLWKLPERSMIPAVGPALSAADEIGVGRLTEVPSRLSIFSGGDLRAFRRWIRRCRDLGLIPVDLDAYNWGGVALFGGIAEPNTAARNWECEVTIGDEFISYVQQRENRGLTLFAFDACELDDQRAEVTLFAPALQSEVRRSWNIGQLASDEVIDELTANKLRPTNKRPSRLSSYLRNKRRFLGVQSRSESNASTRWELLPDVTEAEIRSVLSEAKRQRLRPVDITGDEIEGVVHYSLLLVENSPLADWEVDLGVSDSDWEQVLTNRLRTNVHPAMFSTYIENGSPKHVVIWLRSR